MSSTQPIRHYAGAQSKYEIPLLAGNNVFLGDIYSSDKTNPDKPISGGLFRLNKGEPLIYTYKFDEMKIILEGEFNISDATGQSFLARPGDVLYIPRDSTVTFTTESTGLAFYTAERKEGEV